MFPGRPRDSDAQVGLVLREMECLDTPGEHRGRGLTGVELPAVDLGDVGNEVGLVATGLFQDLEQVAEQLIVRDGLRVRSLSHGQSMVRAPATAGPFAKGIAENRSGNRPVSVGCSTLLRRVREPLGPPLPGARGFARPLAEMDMALRSGEQLGPYEIVSRLGAGGMGEIDRAREIEPQLARPRVLP